MHRLGGGGGCHDGNDLGPKEHVTENPVAGGRVSGVSSLCFILRPHVQVQAEVPLPGVATSHPGLRAVKRMTLLPPLASSHRP